MLICAVILLIFGGGYRAISGHMEAEFHLHLQLFAEKIRQCPGLEAAFVAVAVLRIFSGKLLPAGGATI